MLLLVWTLEGLLRGYLLVKVLGQQSCLQADMVIGAAIAPWGSILQPAERRGRSNIFHSEDLTIAGD